MIAMTMPAADILFLTPQFPVPLDWGGAIRTWHLLDRLRRHGRVCVLAMTRGSGPVPDGCDVHIEPVPFGPLRTAGTALTSMLSGRSLALGRYRSERFGARVARLAADLRVKWVAADHLVMAEYALQVRDVSTVLFAQNAEQTIWRRRAAHSTATKRVLLNREFRKVKAAEDSACRRFNAVFFPTTDDVTAVFGAEAPGTAATIENGVDASFLCPTPVQEHGSEVLLPGSFLYDANRDAADFFGREVWPTVLENVPWASLHVVGKGASRLQTGLGTGPRVRIASDVSDMAPYFHNARVTVVPLRIGGGSRVKIVESMARGTPVVSTTIGAEGLDLRSGVHLEIRDDGPAFAAAVIGLLRNDARWRALANAARTHVAARYTWEQVTEPLAALFSSREI